ncbi:MAG TPA: metallophosphoesterase, partial [Polyangiales bacterium]|nr:metallophosphoesterase [Polyangiales bacterium]
MKRIALACGLVGAACSRVEPKPSPAPAPSVVVNELARPATKRVIAIGDMHGDLEAARRALKLAGAIDEADEWAGGALTLVQTGDVLDRGDDDRKIFDWLERLRPEARAAGGELILLSGNHELMNVAQDFRYVTPGAFGAFDDVGGRAAAFRPGGVYALRIALRPFVMQVGDAVYVHGGV